MCNILYILYIIPANILNKKRDSLKKKNHVLKKKHVNKHNGYSKG